MACVFMCVGCGYVAGFSCRCGRLVVYFLFLYMYRYTGDVGCGMCRWTAMCCVTDSHDFAVFVPFLVC